MGAVQKVLTVCPCDRNRARASFRALTKRTFRRRFCDAARALSTVEPRLTLAPSPFLAPRSRVDP